MCYTHVYFPLTAIDDFKRLATESELFGELWDSCEAHDGLWNAQAEAILLRRLGGGPQA
jgi:hypothetical protein